MRKWAAFTIVELLVTLVVMTILMTLAVVSFRSVQVNARDTEREADVKTISRGLEQRYKIGNTVATANVIQKGSYPSLTEILHMTGVDESSQGFDPGQVSGGYLKLGLPGTTDASFSNPAGQNAFVVFCSSCSVTEGSSTTLNTAFGGQDRYVYEPLKTDNTTCSNASCTHFNLYWKREADNSIQKVESLHKQ